MYLSIDIHIPMHSIHIHCSHTFQLGELIMVVIVVIVVIDVMVVVGVVMFGCVCDVVCLVFVMWCVWCVCVFCAGRVVCVREKHEERRDAEEMTTGKRMRNQKER